MDTPVVARAPRAPQTGGIDQPDLPRAGHSGLLWRVGRRNQFPSSQSNQALEARRRFRQAVSEMSASPISTAQAPRRRPTVPQDIRRSARSRSVGVATRERVGRL